MINFLKKIFIKEKVREYGFGLIGEDPYDGRDFPITAILKADISVPEQYIVPFYRNWFDENFNPVLEEISKGIKNQFKRGSCVSQACSYQKGSQENIPTSARFHHAHCKKDDGLPGEGTYLRTGQDVLVKYGIPENILYPEPDNTMSYGEYIDIAQIPQSVTDNAKNHTSQSYWSVGRTFSAIQQAIYQNNTPMLTGCTWYRGDNNIGSDGIFGLATGDILGGHAFSVIGWIKKNGNPYLVAANSWGTSWGNSGLFYIPNDQYILNRTFQGWMTVDMEVDLAKILVKYDKKNIKTEYSSKLYYISEGSKHEYPDEMAWWSRGNSFSGDYVVVNNEEFSAIPLGESMTFDYAYKWSANQIKELINLLIIDTPRAGKLTKKYFS